MSKSKFLKFVSAVGEEELREELKSLYTKIPEVKLHYLMELGNDEDRKKRYEKAKKDIKNFFYIAQKPRKRTRVAKAKSLIKDIIKHAIFSHEKVDIYLHATEISLMYLLRRPSATQATYNFCMFTFQKAIHLILEMALQTDFEDRCKSIATDAQAVYGLNTEIRDILLEAYEI